MKTLFTHEQLTITIQRLAHQIVEQIDVFEDVVIIGIQPRGIHLSDRVVQAIQAIVPGQKIQYGQLDTTFYRDDVHQNNGIHIPSATSIDFNLEGKQIILIDDVLHTGRTIRAAMDALIDFGRPKHVSLMVLIDRRFSRELPIQPDFVGQSVDTMYSQKVKVQWDEQQLDHKVLLID
ncbi:MAG: bifunctional pyr operon transcriptional regulator/uracil phosphoribosyltransferase PyrR [Bacteroidota bacterium]|nr:bifunctional pyr operon transcriptional regulator/uracil phosphoribosyltransferase PyrR [Chitinophagia bacterium]